MALPVPLDLSNSKISALGKSTLKKEAQSAPVIPAPVTIIFSMVLANIAKLSNIAETYKAKEEEKIPNTSNFNKI
jgi:hypothetical protein